MEKYEEKQQRVMKILNQRQESILKIENGLKDLSKDVKYGMEYFQEINLLSFSPLFEKVGY